MCCDDDVLVDMVLFASTCFQLVQRLPRSCFTMCWSVAGAVPELALQPSTALPENAMLASRCADPLLDDLLGSKGEAMDGACVWMLCHVLCVE